MHDGRRRIRRRRGERADIGFALERHENKTVEITIWEAMTYNALSYIVLRTINYKHMMERRLSTLHHPLKILAKLIHRHKPSHMPRLVQDCIQLRGRQTYYCFLALCAIKI